MARFTLEITDELDEMLDDEADRLHPVIRSKSGLIETVLTSYFGILPPDVKTQINKIINGKPGLRGSGKLAKSQRANT